MSRLDARKNVQLYFIWIYNIWVVSQRGKLSIVGWALLPVHDARAW